MITPEMLEEAKLKLKPTITKDSSIRKLPVGARFPLDGWSGGHRGFESSLYYNKK